jgi:NTE family protein
VDGTARGKVGFVLSGGGSRGAYEAGIIQYLRTDLAKRLGRHVPIDIVTGTSVGAINAAFLASTMEDPAAQCRRLIDAWRALRIEELIGLGARDLWRATTQLFGREPPPPTPGSFRYGGLLDTSGLERFVIKNIPWSGIERNLKSGVLHAMSVSATHIATGHTVVFVSAAGPVPTGWSKDPFVRHQTARIGPRHVLASAAIPLLFPSVKVGDSFYTDGGLRQNTPMSPAIRLGADKMLMVSLRHVDEVAPRQPTVPDGFPRPLFLVGKALNALMLDHTDYDLDRMKRLNAVLEAGTAAFGPDVRRRDERQPGQAARRADPPDRRDAHPSVGRHRRAGVGVRQERQAPGVEPGDPAADRGHGGRRERSRERLPVVPDVRRQLGQRADRAGPPRRRRQGRGAGPVLHGVIAGGPT